MVKLLCGRNPVLEALNSDLKIKTLYLAKPLNIKIDKSIKIIIKSRSELDRMTKQNHQGFIAELEDFNYFGLDTIMKDKPNLVLMLDHIEDPHNLGAIIRTANAAGVKHIILPKDRAAKVNSTVLKVASGGITNMKVIRVSSLIDSITKLKKEGFWIYATALENGQDIDNVTFNDPTVLIVGNEGKGVSKTLLKHSDQNVYINMKGTVQSLNVSVATGIALFKIIK